MIKKFQLNQESLLNAIIIVNIIIFCISLILSGSSVNFDINPFSALSPSVKSLIFLGASGTIPMDNYNQWWSLISASWLHGGLLHLIFNMTALKQIGPFVIKEFGMYRMILIYTISGISGFFISYLAGVMVTIGASAAICGLIGATLYYGKSRGGLYGQAIFKQTSGWVFGLVLFGLFIPNINNWGHGGGLAAGIVTGFILGYNERNRENALHKILSIPCVFATACILLWSVISACYLTW